LCLFCFSNRKLENESPVINQTFHLESFHDDNHNHRLTSYRIPRATLRSPPSKPVTAMGGIKVLPSTSHRPLKSSYLSTINKPRRVASFTIADSTSPINYRKYLRHTDQAAHLYGEDTHRQQHQSASLEHSLGYYP